MLGSIEPLFPFPGLPTQRMFQATRRELVGTLEKLATGRRINRGSDDPAGLITSENLRSMLAQLEAETRTLQRADHVIATADGALGEVSGMLSEIDGLVVANASNVLSDDERAANQLQIDSLRSSINRIASTTSFNGQHLLDGTLTLEAGGQSVVIEDVTLAAIGEGEAAQTAVADARTRVTTLRARLGALSNHVQSGLNAIGVSMENIAAADSLLADTNFGQETANLARLQTLENVSLYTMLATRNLSRNVLLLLG